MSILCVMQVDEHDPSILISISWVPNLSSSIRIRNYHLSISRPWLTSFLNQNSQLSSFYISSVADLVRDDRLHVVEEDAL